MSSQVIAGVTFVSNLWLWQTTDYFNADFFQQPLLHLWSLGVEEQFYLFWPVILLVAIRTPKWRSMSVAVIGVASFAANIVLVHQDAAATFYLPFTRLWELLAGAWLAVLAANRNLHKQPDNAAVGMTSMFCELISYAGLALILTSVLLASDSQPYPGWRAAVPVVGAALLIAAGPNAFLNKHLLSSRPAVYIGLISFPLYLWHLPMLYMVRAFEIESKFGVRLLRLGLLLVAFALAALTRQFFEMRVQRLPRRQAVRGLVFTLVALVLAACGVLAGSGFPSRFQSEKLAVIAQLESARATYAGDYREGRCFIVKQSQSFDVPSECTPGPGGLIVWGDSYGAHLHPGLAHEIAARDSTHAKLLGQLTAGACPPVLLSNASTATNRCRMTSQAFAQRVQLARPALVILSASWLAYLDRPGFQEDLRNTLVTLRASGTSVLVVGPTVAFGSPVWQVALRHLREDRAVNSSLPALRAADGRLRQLTKSSGADYLSALDDACDETRCAFTVEVDGKRELLSWDTGHLTRSASVWQARRMLNDPLVRDWLSR